MTDQNSLSTVLQLSNQIPRSTIAVLDALVQRGAFRGEEMLTIGQLREQCTQLIQAVEAVQEEDDNIEGSDDH